MSNKNGRKGMPKRIRFEVLQRDGFKCRYCGKVAAETELQVDHLKPFADGGTDEGDNLVTACNDCNRGKGDMPAIRDESGKHPKHNETSFKPGESGNPEGRPKLDPEQRAARVEAQAILDAATPAAALALVELLDHLDPRARLGAASTILDRSGLKGVTRVELTGEGGGPVNTQTQVTHVADPARVLRLVQLLVTAGAHPVGVGGTERSADAAPDEVHDSVADGAAAGLPPG